MNIDDAIEVFSHYSSQEKINFLLQLSHALTILARATYEVAGEGLTDPARLRAINELQHRITGFLLALRKNDMNRYPDDVFLKIILDQPQDLELQQQLQQAFANLMAERITMA